MSKVLSPKIELDRFLDRSTTLFTEAVLGIVGLYVRSGTSPLPSDLDEFGDLIRYTQGQAHLFGARRLLLEVDARRARYGLASSWKYEDTPTPLVPNVPPEKAIADLLFREPRLARTAEAISELYNRGYGFAMARASSEVIVERAKDYIAAYLTGNGRMPDTAQAIADLGGWARAYGETVFRTNVTTAYANGRLSMATDPVVSDFVAGVRRVEVLDSDTRPNHRASHGLMAPANSRVWVDHGVPGGYNCVPGNTIVEGVFHEAARILYLGDVLEVFTESGSSLVITPNHPVPTARGTVKAADLEVGDNLLKYTPYECSILLDQVNYHNPPSRIDEVFGAFAKRGYIRSLDATAVDFNGDALFGKGDIDVVDIDGKLAGDIEPGGDKDAEDSALVGLSSEPALVDRRGSLKFLRAGNGPAPGGLPGRGTLADDLSPAVACPFQSLRFGAAADLDTPRLESWEKGGTTDAQFYREALERNPGRISPDRVVKIERRAFSGHVYDLSSVNGWFVASGIVISNCRGTYEIVDTIEAERMGVKLVNGKLPEPRIPAGAYNDPGFTGKTSGFKF